MDLVQMAYDLGGELAPEPEPAPRVWRVALVAPDGARLTREWRALMQRLIREGFEVHALAHDPTGAMERLALDGVITRALPPVAGPLALGALAVVQGHLLEHPPALVHGFGHWIGWGAALAGQRAGALATLTTQDALPEWGALHKLAPLRDALAALTRALLSRVDACVVPSPDALRALQELGAPVDRVEIMEGGAGVALDASAAPPPPPSAARRASARSALGLPQGWTCVFGVVGPWTRASGADTLLRLIDLSASPSRGWLIALEDLQDQASRRALDARARAGLVHIIEPTTRAHASYDAMDVAVSVSAQRAAPLWVLEAAARGVPTAGLDQPALRAISPDPQALASDLTELTAQLDRLARDPALRASLGRAAHDDATRRFSRDAAVSQLLAIYDRILAPRA